MTGDAKHRGRSPMARLAGWGIAVALSALLNITLFGLMPGLTRLNPHGNRNLDDVQAIQVIRVKRSEPPPRKKERKPPEPDEKPDVVKTATPTRVVTPRPLAIKPRLPFALNPKLPATPTSLSMPPIQQFSMSTPTMKGIYGMAELDNPLTPLVKAPPIYPMRAMRRGIEGWVKIRFQVDKTGKVTLPEILAAEPEGLFEKSVMSCVMQWKFKPGTVEGVAVNTMAETTIRFQLEE